MQKIIFLLILGLGLLTLTACSLSRQTKQQAPALDISEQPQAIEPIVLSDGEYKVNPETSRLAWQGNKLVASHTGLISIKSGSIQVDNGVPTKASFIIDMKTITSDQNLDGLVKHLESSDFFDIATYPEAKLIVNTIQPGSSVNEYVLDGDLTIKEITAPVSLTARIINADNGLEAQSQLIIDRTTWNIKFLSGKFFENLGDKMIDDEIKFDIKLQLAK